MGAGPSGRARCRNEPVSAMMFGLIYLVNFLDFECAARGWYGKPRSLGLLAVPVEFEVSKFA